MNKADKYFKENLRTILDEGESTEGHKIRPRYKNGLPAHTVFINQVVEKYDINKGEFPITTLRPIAWKSAIKEIMVIYQDQLNTKEAFEKKGIFWWNNWFNEEGNIGRAYSYNLESHRDGEQIRDVVLVPIKRKMKEELEYDHGFPINPINNFCKEDIVRERFIILKKISSRKYIIQDIVTGEIAKVSKGFINCEGDIFKNVNLKYTPKYYGIGFIGNLENINNFEDWEIDILKRKWVAMLKRITTYSQYKDVLLDKRWENFSNFLEDVRHLPQYHLAKEEKFVGWDLDKDYYGANFYGKDSCVFLKNYENKLYAKNKGLAILVHPNGKEESFISLVEASKKYGLSHGNLESTTLGKRNHTHGYSAYFKNPPEGYVYRYELSRNQVENLLNGLINEPYSRRHIISLWNWQNMNKKTLVECAYETVWSVRDGYLDMTLHQRSSDYCVANHINKIQYVALMMMVARHVGLKPGVFMHVVDNLHIYDLHIPNAYELLKREPSDKEPKLILKEGKTSFYNFTIDDFELIDYDPVKPQLKFELGI